MTVKDADRIENLPEPNRRLAERRGRGLATLRLLGNEGELADTPFPEPIAPEPVGNK